MIIESINAAKAHMMALCDEHLPDWDDEARRMAFISAIEEVFAALDVALFAATTPKALGCVLPRPSEDGTTPPAPADGWWPGHG